MGLFQSFSTDQLPPGQRLSSWNEWADRVYSGTFVNASAEDFVGRMARWELGPLEMLRPSASSAYVGRKSCDRPVEHLILHIQYHGRSRHRQGASETELECGDLVLGDAQRPYDFDLTDHELLVVQFPKQPMIERVPDLEDGLLRRVPGQIPTSRILRDFLLSLWREGAEGLASAEQERDMAAIFYELLATALRNRPEPLAKLPEALALQRMRDLVEEELGDPSFGTARLAKQLGLSSRSVQLAFARAGTTPSAYILERRLRRAADSLAREPTRPITDIAYAYGFNDSGYFARCFRRAFRRAA